MDEVSRSVIGNSLVILAAASPMLLAMLIDWWQNKRGKHDALPFWERVGIKISLFINGIIYWRVANILWRLFRYDLFDGRFVNNLEPDPQCDAEYAAGQYEEYNNIDDFIASFEDDK